MKAASKSGKGSEWGMWRRKAPKLNCLFSETSHQLAKVDFHLILSLRLSTATLFRKVTGEARRCWQFIAWHLTAPATDGPGPFYIVFQIYK